MIAQRLTNVLDDESKVAILCSEEDLVSLISALSYVTKNCSAGEIQDAMDLQMLKDLEKLREKAFC